MTATAGAIRAGRAFVELLADDTKLQAALKRVQKDLKAFGKGVEEVGKKMSLMGAGIAAPMLAAVKVFADAGSGLYDMSKRTGVAVETLGSLGYAAQQSGADMGTLENGIRKMQKTLTEAATKGGAAAEAFTDIGLDPQKLAGKGPEDQFLAIAEALSAIADPSMKAAAAMEIFGKSGTMLLPMMEEGAAGLAKMTEEARKNGGVMSTDAAKASDALGDSLDAMMTTLGSVWRTLGEQLEPAVTDAASAISAMATNAREWIGEHKQLIVVVGEVAVGMVALGGAMTLLGPAIGVVSTALLALTAMLVTNPILLLPIAVAAVAAAFVDWGAVVHGITGDIVKNVNAVGNALKGLEGATAEAQLSALENQLEKLREERKSLEEQDRNTSTFNMQGSKEEVDAAFEAWEAKRKGIATALAANRAADGKLVDEIVPRMEALAKIQAAQQAFRDNNPLESAGGDLREADDVARRAQIAHDSEEVAARDAMLKKQMMDADKADQEARAEGIADLQDALDAATRAMDEAGKNISVSADTLTAGSKEAAQALLGRETDNDPVNKAARETAAATKKTVDLLDKILEEQKNAPQLKEAGLSF